MAKICPLREKSDYKRECDEGCMWWNDIQEDCAINLLVAALFTAIK